MKLYCAVYLILINSNVSSIELREDNNALLEAKCKIEEQLTAANKRSENMVDDLVRAQLQLEEVSNVRCN